MNTTDTIAKAAPRLRITITAVIEYEANPAHYEDCSTPEDMLEASIQDAEVDTLGVMEQAWIDGNLTVKASGEIISQARQEGGAA